MHMTTQRLAAPSRHLAAWCSSQASSRMHATLSTAGMRLPQSDMMQNAMQQHLLPSITPNQQCLPFPT
jgi:hypothetical protein